MYNTKRKRGCKSQGGCTANGASRPTGDRFKTHEGRTAEELFKLQDELKRTKAKLNKANKEVKMLRSCLRYSDGKLINVRLKVAELYESLGVSVGDDFDGLDELDL